MRGRMTQRYELNVLEGMHMLFDYWRRIFLSALITCLFPSAFAATAAERGVWFGGYDVVTGSRYVYDGLVVAVNGDLGKDGFAVRAYGARGDFDQDPGDGRAYQADIAVGYLFSVRQLSGSFFVGMDWQNIKLRPDDPTAEVRGTEFGVRVSGDLSTARKATLLRQPKR